MTRARQAQCRYTGEWVATKLRWQLTADVAEYEALEVFAEGPCEDTVVTAAAVWVIPQCSAPHAGADFFEEFGPFAVLAGEREVVSCVDAVS